MRTNAKPVRPRAWLAAVTLLAAATFLPTGQAHACACCGSYQVVNVASWDVLNVRSGPGVGFRIIETLGPGEACIGLTGVRRGNWVQVNAKGITGWVNRKYLQWVP